MSDAAARGDLAALRSLIEEQGDEDSESASENESENENENENEVRIESDV